MNSIEHVSHSKCRSEFLLRLKANKAAKDAAKAKGEKLAPGSLKRQPAQPEASKFIRGQTQTLYPQAYAGLVD
jgi:large subunit ribosomal protein L21e